MSDQRLESHSLLSSRIAKPLPQAGVRGRGPATAVPPIMECSDRLSTYRPVTLSARLSGVESLRYRLRDTAGLGRETDREADSTYWMSRPPAFAQ